MLCKKCMSLMVLGTTYEKRRGKSGILFKRFHMCKKCGDIIYSKEPNFQEYANKNI